MGAYGPVERLLGVAPVPQPSPGVNPGGDCFACATLAMARYFWPEEAAAYTVADAVEWWRTQKVYGSDALAIGNTMSYASRSLANLPDPMRLQVITDPWQQWISDEHQPHGPVYGVRNYGERVEAYLAAGWVAFTDIVMHPAVPHFLKPKPEGGYWNTSPDHNLLIDGIRTVVVGDEEGCGAHTNELHIVCSVRGAYWIDQDTWLREYGGRFIWWCRPRRDLPWRSRDAASTVASADSGASGEPS